MALTEFAWAEEYVQPGGAGANDGTSFANAWDITQVAASMALGNGKRFNIAGNYTLAANLGWTTTGTSVSQFSFRGWKSDLSIVSQSFADNPIVDGAASYLLQPGSYQNYRGLRLTNFNIGLSNVGADNVGGYLLEVDNCVSHGVDVDDWLFLNKCRIHSNGGDGVLHDAEGRIFNSEIYDNVGDGIDSIFNGQSYINNFIARNANGVVNGGGSRGILLLNNTFDDNGNAFLSLSGPSHIVSNQFTNNTKGVSGTATNNRLNNNNFWNNGTDSDSNIVLVDGNYSIDPDYVDVANNDYEIQEASLIGIGAGRLLGTENVGAWQSVGGGGGGGGMLVHPGMSGGLRG